jgi:hypothetical protein
MRIQEQRIAFGTITGHLSMTALFSKYSFFAEAEFKKEVMVGFGPTTC